VIVELTAPDAAAAVELVDRRGRRWTQVVDADDDGAVLGPRRRPRARSRPSERPSELMDDPFGR
jgi:hypothetical protein